ncbi:HAD family hydrolase [Lacimicrobium alkaliphilum]|uniref:phosphoserine phosphatase n=1 Tax=Lacimicrobium alkaliphilum TaxID=1526571 RepID=A0A0U3B680_9ALTE|nr:HAD family phosphatase [Lacimicrobium alkaliphilum]ALS97173.1 phosphoserine phosphatase [Lacimicrobium alkaliphilum]
MNNKFPAIWFFDMEGTLLKKEYSLDNGKVAPSAWTVLARKLGEQCYLEEEKTKDRWLNGEYRGYLDWMADTVEIHKKYGLRKELVDQVVEDAKLYNGAEELFKWLRENKAITVLITGGFKALADKVQRKLKINHAFSGCEYFYDENNLVEFANLLPSDNQGKASFMRQVIEEHGVSSKDCIFIGDGMNDIYLAKEVGFSIAFNAQNELSDIASASINQGQNKENLLEIKELISSYFIIT